MRCLTPLPVRIVLAAIAVALAVTGCGKDLNVHPSNFFEFPNALPEAPRALAVDAPPGWTSSRAIAVDDALVYVVNRDGGELVIMDRATLGIVRQVAVGSHPRHVAVGPEGEAWVTIGGEGRLVRVDAGADSPSQVLELGGEPYGVALTPGAAHVLVSDFALGRVLVIDASSGQTVLTVPAGHLPRGLAVGEAGRVYVVQQTGEVVSFELRIDETGVHAEGVRNSPLRVGSPADNALNPGRLGRLAASRATALTAVPGSGNILAVHMQVEPGTSDAALAEAEFAAATDAPATDGYGSAGGSNLNFDVPARPAEASITVLDVSGEARTGTVALPVQWPATGEPMNARLDSPSDINHHPTMSLAFVTGEGTDNMLVFNTASLDGDPLAHPVAEISVGMAPRAVALSPDGKRAYVLNGHAFTVSEVDLEPLLHMPRVEQKGDTGDAPRLARTEAPTADAVPESGDVARFVRPMSLTAEREVAFGVDPASEAVRRGRRVFNYARNERLSRDGQFACATCHLEGTQDNQVWFIKDGPRQTIALGGRLDGTAPFNWSGSKPELQHNMEQTVARMGGEGLTKAELADLEQFMLVGLEAPRNPWRDPAGLTAQQELGRAIFEDPQVGCGTCHAGAALTDGAVWDVGATTADERRLLEMARERDDDPELPPVGFFNTPSLRGLWYTAPYLHNGRAETLYDVLDLTAGQMGETADLSADEVDALVSYLLTL